MDSDQGVAVAAFVKQRQVELEWRAPVAFGYHASTGSNHCPDRGSQQTPEPGCVAVWRVQEHEIVLTAGLTCLPQERSNGLATQLGVDAERLKVAADRIGRGRRAVDERRRCGAAGERLDPQRAGAREQVE